MNRVIYKKTLALILTVLMSVGCLAGCGNQKNEAEATASTEQVTEQAPSVSAQQGSDTIADTIIVTDCSGAKVEIPKNIQRVIAPNQPFAAFMIAMGQGDKLIGSHGSVLGHTWAPYFKEDILSLDLYGYKPEAETLIAANADLIVVKNPAYAETLRNEGLPAIYFAYSNIDELYYAIDLMGDIFGDEAKEYVAKWKTFYEETRASIGNDLSSLSEEDKKSVYYINGAVNPSTVYTTFGGGSFTEYWINSIGGILATSEFDDIEEIDQEVAIGLNPDVIFISGYAEYTRYDELMADPLWTDINAVMNNEIYLMPTSLVSYDRFAVELPMLLDYSASVLYPELHSFGGTDALKEFYQEFYGLTFSDDELNLMLLGLSPDGSRMD